MRVVLRYRACGDTLSWGAKSSSDSGLVVLADALLETDAVVPH